MRHKGQKLLTDLFKYSLAIIVIPFLLISQLFTFLACINIKSREEFTQKRNPPQRCLSKWPYRKERHEDGKRRHVKRKLKIQKVTNDKTNLITLFK